MSKRAADKYLTDQNWDREEEDEERGMFHPASTDVLSQRTIIKAKRRCNPGGADGGDGSTLFKGFTGFSKSVTDASSKSADSSSPSTNNAQNADLPLPVPSSQTLAKQLGRSNDLSELNKCYLAWISEQVSKDAACDLTPIFTGYCDRVKNMSKTNDNGVTSTGSGTSPAVKKPDETESNAKPSENVVPLSELFKKASDSWDCPVCLVTNKNADAKCVACTSARPAGVTLKAAEQPAPSKPTVADSSNQPSLAELFKKSADEWECKSCWVRNKSSASECVACTAKNPSAVAPASKTDSTSSASASTETSSTSTFSFAPEGGFNFKPAGGSLFNFGSNSTSTGTLFGFKPKESAEENKGTTGSTFSFGTSFSTPSSGFSFGLGAKSAESADTEKGDGEADDEYIPPKTESVAHAEDGAFYSVRCKLFYQKDGQWIDRGVGNLFLKSCGENNDRTQLLIRTDTSLGNILLNVMLNANVPVSRQGSNNVSLACVPNPPIESSKPSKQPVCMLIRVKTEQMADELFAKVNESKSEKS